MAAAGKNGNSGRLGIGLGGRRGAPSRKKRALRPGLVLAVALVLVAAYSVLVFKTLHVSAPGKEDGAIEGGGRGDHSPAASTDSKPAKSPPQALRASSSGAKPSGAAQRPPALLDNADGKAAMINPRRRRRRADERFPRFGTENFARTCNWTAAPAATPLPGRDCVFMARPNPKSNEGLAAWAGMIASASVLALQTGCRLLIDYGPGVDVGSILAPRDAADGFPALDWTVPEGYGNCTRAKHCRDVSDNFKRAHTEQFAKSLRHMMDRPPLVPAPKYRFIYKKVGAAVKFEDAERDLGLSLPGFKTETGMACAFERLFQLAPTASKYSEGLFDKILPAVRDPDALVIAVYIRTGRTDKVSSAEADGKAIGRDTQRIGGTSLPQRAVDKAIEIEGALLATEDGYARVVWMIISDSPSAKKLIAEAYDGKMAAASGGCIRDGIEAVAVPRTVLTTSARGVQTKPKRGPSTEDFAEAYLDWHLIGESDVVITQGGISFGSTAALRTARPIISGVHNCSLEIVALGGD